MRYSSTLFAAVLLLLFLGGIRVAQGGDKPMSNDLGKIQPPAGVPLNPGGAVISVDMVSKTSKRQEAAGSSKEVPLLATEGLQWGGAF
jgi:hypothetical protein